MTKLFSMKSVAFAGAAAFALALAAAPETDAATLETKVDYNAGTLIVEASDLEGGDLIETADGLGLYTGFNKNASKIKYTLTMDGQPITIRSAISGTKKIAGSMVRMMSASGSAVTTGGGVTTGGAVDTTGGAVDTTGGAVDTTGGAVDTGDGPITEATLTFDITKYLGKKTYVGVSLAADGADAKTVELAASPTLKARFKGGLELNVDKGGLKAFNEVLGSGYACEYKVGAYGVWKRDGADGDLEDAIAKAQAFGSTIYVRIAKSVQKDGVTELTTPWSKEVKFKVSAKAKAPKIAAKTTNLTKAFEWKMGNKLEYIVTVNGDSTEWEPGATSKIGWAEILKNAGVKDSDSLVEGDAIAADIMLQVRTAKTDKKAASNINVLKLAASMDSPLGKDIKIDVKEDTKKKNPAKYIVSIAPANVTGYVAEYQTGDGKWKKVTKSTDIKANKLSSDTVYVRLMSTDKKSVILPSAVTTVKISEVTKETDDESTKKTWQISATGFVKGEDEEAGKWILKTADNYNNSEGSWAKEEEEKPEPQKPTPENPTPGTASGGSVTPGTASGSGVTSGAGISSGSAVG